MDYYKDEVPQDDGKYLDSDYEEEEIALTHADHKENGNISYKAKGEFFCVYFSKFSIIECCTIL